jgi:DNA invertase Pin-like site-specific DNA recombinase
LVLNTEKNYIKFVANYLRKSRGEDESDLDKHRFALREFCEKQGWKYVEYLEIETGDSIAARPVMQKLLKDVEEGIYDAVCVVEYDRLGRGDLEDQGKIKKTFLKSDTLIATPSKVYDLSNDDDDFVADVKGFLARQEYKMIVKRLKQGKKFGAKRGDWVSGTPPYPYEYERWQDKYRPKGLVVNEDKLKIYRLIVESTFEGKTPFQIATMLNQMNIPSPRLKQWDKRTIISLIQDETHLGRITSNKTTGWKRENGKAYNIKKLPRSEWTIVENCHQPVKTQEEHDQILMIIAKRNDSPVKARAGTYPLTGLIKCHKCGRTMTFAIKPNGAILVKTCPNHDALGNKCGNGGIHVDYIYAKVEEAILKYEEQLQKLIDTGDNGDFEKVKSLISIKEKELLNRDKAMDRVNEAYEAGVYDLTETKKRKEKIKIEYDRIKEEIELLKRQLENSQLLTNEDKLEKVAIMKEIFKHREIVPPKEINTLLKDSINTITWIKTGNKTGKVDVSFI